MREISKTNNMLSYIYLSVQCFFTMAKVKKSSQMKHKTIQPKQADTLDNTIEQINKSSPIASRVRSKKIDTLKKNSEINDKNCKQINKTSPIDREASTKLYSIKHDDKNKTKFKIKQCVVRLDILTREQIVDVIENGLANIEIKDVQPYNLRKRATKHEKPKERKLSRSTKVASSLITPSDLTATALWKFLKTDIPEIAPKLLCLAKMNTYSPWPAMVVKVLGKRSEVYFFGDGKTGIVNTSEIVPFERCSVLVKKYLHLRGYSRSVRELELSLNIPYQSSLTNDER